MYELVEKYLKLHIEDMKREEHFVLWDAYYLNFKLLSVEIYCDTKTPRVANIFYKNKDTGLSIEEKEKIRKIIWDYLDKKNRERLKELEKELECDLEKKPTESFFRRLFSRKGE